MRERGENEKMKRENEIGTNKERGIRWIRKGKKREREKKRKNKQGEREREGIR